MIKKNKTYIDLYNALINSGYKPRTLSKIKLTDNRFIKVSTFVLTAFDSQYHLFYRISSDENLISEFNKNKKVELVKVESLIYD